MCPINPTVESVGANLEFLKEIAKKGNAGNVPRLFKRNNKEYREALEKIEYWQFVQSADYHYFVSRILFLHYVPQYSQFCGQQCIENYLNAYLKFKNQTPPNSHDLSKLLKICRGINPSSDAFIQSDNITVIIAKYEPFYELARYPIQNIQPVFGYANIFPDDIFLLDYFVMKMREILTIPVNTWDILKDGHFDLVLCQRESPDFYNSLFIDNINFLKKTP